MVLETICHIGIRLLATRVDSFSSFDFAYEHLRRTVGLVVWLCRVQSYIIDTLALFIAYTVITICWMLRDSKHRIFHRLRYILKRLLCPQYRQFGSHIEDLRVSHALPFSTYFFCHKVYWHK